MDDELERLYHSRWDVLSNAIPERRGMSKPLLAAVPPEYEMAKIRLLIIGKETNGWGSWDEWSESAGDHVDWLRNEYTEFGRGRDTRGKLYNSPFFQAARGLQSLLNPGCEFMWLNLFVCSQKRGDKWGLPEKSIAEELRKVSFLREEVRILKPAAVIFFTGSGPNDKGAYDFTITHERYFPGAEFSYHPGRLWSVIENAVSLGLPEKTVRTYHPGFLWRNKERRLAIDEIADWVKQ